jgi:PadR family transcriptional regulator PadR
VQVPTAKTELPKLTEKPMNRIDIALLIPEERDQAPDCAAIKNRAPLGPFEFSLLGAIEILGTDAYGAQLGRYLSEKLHRDVTAPQVYMTLERLAKRGLVRSENTDPVSARGGRSRKRFIIEASGARALKLTAAAFNAIPTSQGDRNDATTEVECPA